LVTQPATPTKTRVVTGRLAARLVREFNDLRVEPPSTIHCDAIGGTQTIVTFTTPRHTWVARQSACTNVEVSRDDLVLPTLLPSTSWGRAVAAALS
jgi:hypothetical protein